nr:hypothetical protein Pyn_33203 [Ipomoea trifida]
MSGRVGYLKLTCFNSISPRTADNVVPCSLLESILGFLSRMSKIEAVESLALLSSARGSKKILMAVESSSPNTGKIRPWIPAAIAPTTKYGHSGLFREASRLIETLFLFSRLSENECLDDDPWLKDLLTADNLWLDDLIKSSESVVISTASPSSFFTFSSCLLLPCCIWTSCEYAPLGSRINSS